MKVAVVGSQGSSRNNGTEKKAFDAICKQVNRVLVERRCTLLVAHSDSHTAEAAVLSHGNLAVEKVNKSKFWATTHIHAVKKAHAVIVIGGQEGSTVAGLFALSEKKQFFPIALAGGAGSQFWRRLQFPADAHEKLTELNNNIEPFTSGWTTKFRKALGACLSMFPTVVIIHGRSRDRREVAELLTNNGIRAITLDTSPGGGTLAELWDRFATHANGAIAIATPDDIGGAAVDDGGGPISVSELRLQLRARQNVWVEVGWAWGRLSLERMRVMIPRELKLEIPSDLAGLRMIQYVGSPRESEAKIMEFCKLLES